MPLPPSAPYDTLATVTQMVRTNLADFVANLQPNNAGTVNTDGTGIGVTWISGNKFTFLFVNQQITINGLPYTVASVTSPTTLTLVNTAPINQIGVAYSLIVPTGEIFADSQAYVLPTINLAWRKLQKKLDMSSHPRLRGDVVLTGLPAVTSQDPSSQQWVNWTGFFDGTNLQTSPVLPSDFMSPLRLYERQNVGAATNLNGFSPMSPVSDGLPSVPKGSYNGCWDWREDAIYFVGSILSMDLRIQYQAFLPDIVSGATFASTVVPIMRCAEALSYYAAGIFVEPRGGGIAGNFEARGDQACDVLTNREAKRLQRVNVRRRAVYDSSGNFRRY